MKCNTLQGKWQERGEMHQFLPQREYNASALERNRLTPLDKRIPVCHEKHKQHKKTQVNRKGS
jgi:hypothetical protein